MPKPIRLYVRSVDAISAFIGKVAMGLPLVMLGILLFSAIGRQLGLSLVWSVEMAQFVMAAFYFVAGASSMLLFSHVRMDLLYGRLSPRRRALTDVFTVALLIFYLVVLLIGAISSTEYALQYGQTSHSAWGPSLIPIKIIMLFGIVLMLLQAISMFFKDLATAMGRTIDGEPLDE